MKKVTFYFTAILPVLSLSLFRRLALLLFVLLPLMASAQTAVTENSLQLSAEEKSWLKEHPTLKMTGDPDWLPFEAFDKNGKYTGIVADHINLISKKLNIDIELIVNKTWSESVEMAKKGQVDILSVTNVSELKSHLNFTKSYISNPIIIVMTDKENYVESIGSIKDKKIALIKGYGYVTKIVN